MLPPGSLLGILFALISAASWGGGDYSGGRAARRHHALQVVILSVLASLALLLFLALLKREFSMTLESIGWAAAAGASGVLGTALLYRGLARGNAAAVAPTAAVVGAAVPVLFAAASQGLPGTTALAGFATGLVGIALVSAAPAGRAGGIREISLAVLSGLGFGGFFVFISLGQDGQLFAPLVIAKLASLGVAYILLRGQRLPLPVINSNPAALLAGALDVGGNVFFLLARQLTRLDVAAVLASMYPAMTVLLARRMLHEHVSPVQWLGMGLCLLAIALIAL